MFTQELDHPDQPFEFFAAVLSGEERRRAERFCRARDGQRFTVARGMLRHTLGGVLGIAPADVPFSYSEHGKPALAETGIQVLPVQFNVAHSDHIALLAVTAVDAVGIDIERIRPVKLRDGIIAKHCSPCEQEAFHQVPPAERTEAFFRIWTRKEAMVKAIGTGLSLPLTSFDVSIAASHESTSHASALIAMRHPDHAARPWSLWPLAAPAGFCAALAVARGGPIQVQQQPA